MNLTNEKVTAPAMSAPTDNGQSLTTDIEISIAESGLKSNINFAPENAEKQLRRMNEPDYLHTVSLTELYDTAYQPKAQIVDDFLCAGTYIFAGGPKVGKSFFMAQLGYHVSSGVPYGSVPFIWAPCSIWLWRTPLPGCKSGSPACLV